MSLNISGGLNITGSNDLICYKNGNVKGILTISGNTNLPEIVNDINFENNTTQSGFLNVTGNFTVTGTSTHKGSYIITGGNFNSIPGNILKITGNLTNSHSNSGSIVLKSLNISSALDISSDLIHINNLNLNNNNFNINNDLIIDKNKTLSITGNSKFNLNNELKFYTAKLFNTYEITKIIGTTTYSNGVELTLDGISPGISNRLTTQTGEMGLIKYYVIGKALGASSYMACNGFFNYKNTAGIVSIIKFIQHNIISLNKNEYDVNFDVTSNIIKFLVDSDSVNTIWTAFLKIYAFV